MDNGTNAEYGKGTNPIQGKQKLQKKRVFTILQNMRAIKHYKGLLLYLRSGNMKKILYLIGLWILLTGFSFRFDLMGYTVAYEPQPEQEVINRIEMPPEPISGFKNEISQLNEMPQITNALLLIGYARIGFTDTDTMQRYVIAVGENGTIINVYLSQEMQADAELSGSIAKIKDYALRGDYERLKLAVNVPFKIKLRILMRGIGI